MIFGGLGRFTVFEVFQSREQGGLSYGRAGPPDPAPRYRTERETFASLRS
jgi:hypothetical protein